MGRQCHLTISISRNSAAAILSRALAGTLAAESLDAGAIPRRQHERGAGAALRAGIFSGCLLARRSRTALSSRQCRLALLFRQGRDPAERHAPGIGGAGTDADPARRCAPRMGRGLGADATKLGLHQSHAVAGSARKMASRLVRDAAAASAGDHLRDQSPLPRTTSAPAFRRTSSASGT